jgi:hypothetical protein
MTTTTLNWDGITDDELIAELKRRGRLREYGAQRSVPVEAAKDPAFVTWAHYEMAVDMGHFMTREAATETESRGIYGEKLLSMKVTALLPQSEIFEPEPERA